MHLRAKILPAAFFSLLSVTLLAQSPAPRVVYLPYTETQPIVEALEDLLPPELKNLPGEKRAAAWPGWVKRRDGEIRARLARGDEDSIVNLLLFGTSFTRQPRVTDRDLARLGGGAQPNGSPSSEARENVLLARIEDFVRALGAPGANERLAFALQVIQQRGFDLSTPPGREHAKKYLLESLARVLREQVGYQATLNEARRLANTTEEFAQRSRLYRDRGLSLDASLRPNFALEQSLAELKRRGLLPAGGVRRVAVIGPGLDFADKQSGYDFYPEQTIQPFAVMYSVLRLGLADEKSLEVLTFDISPRVHAHVSRARQRAAAGTSYTVQLPRDPDVPWRQEFVQYWERFGDRIGSTAKAAAPPKGLEELRIRAVRVRANAVSKVRPVTLNVVLQRLESAAGQGFDLIVATNILVYYDTFEQCLALKNIERMLQPGGFLLSNNALLELPSSRVHSVGYQTTVYSDSGDDGDHVVWYQKNLSLAPRP